MTPPRRPSRPRFPWESVALLVLCVGLLVGIITCSNAEADRCRDNGGVVDRYGRVGEFVTCEMPGGEP